MELSVTIEEKKQFLHWFIDHFKMEAHDMSWFLQDLLENEQALEYMHFVRDITDCPKGMKLIITPNNEMLFRFFKGNVKTEDVYTAYHELQLYQHEKFYLQVNFPDCQNNPLYNAVLEADAMFQKEIKLETEALLTSLLHDGKISYLKRKINDTLKQKDHEGFICYSNQLKALKSKGNESSEMG